jgi:cytochrome c
MTGHSIASKRLTIFLLMAALASGLPGPAPSPRAQAVAPAPPAVERGRLIAQRDCASCHAIGVTGESPLEGAPRWRDLHNRFDVADLAEALAEGIMVGHEEMPSRAFAPDEVEGLVAYLKSLETTPPR